MPASLRRLPAIAVLFVLPVTALADPAAGAACAARLPPDAAMIYRATAPEIRRDTVIRDLLSTRVRSMVIEGKIDRAAARPAAEAAGPCLQALR
jgi:hypothetical protein